MNRILALLLLTAAATANADDTTHSDLPPATTRNGVTYEKDIKPIFENSCVKCHGGQKAKAKLHLDSLAGALKGSEDGKVIHPGESASSPLVKSISHLTEEDLWMPPVKNKFGIKPLNKDQIGLIRAWIDQGAK